MLKNIRRLAACQREMNAAVRVEHLCDISWNIKTMRAVKTTVLSEMILCFDMSEKLCEMKVRRYDKPPSYASDVVRFMTGIYGSPAVCQRQPADGAVGTGNGQVFFRDIVYRLHKCIAAQHRGDYPL